MPPFRLGAPPGGGGGGGGGEPWGAFYRKKEGKKDLP